MKHATPEQIAGPYPERKLAVPANRILLALLTLGTIGLYGWHRSLHNRTVGDIGGTLTAETIAPLSPGKMPLKPKKIAVSSEADALGDAEWQSIRSQIAEADRAFVSTPTTPGIYKAFNRSRNLAFTVSAEAVEVRPRTGGSANSDWFIRLALPQSDGVAIPASPEANRIEIGRNGMTEWYVHHEDGLEQGFTLETPSAGQPLDEIAINLAVETSLVPQLADSAVRFVNSSGQSVLSYEKLQAYDADGLELPTTMQLVSAGGTTPQDTIRLVVDTSAATYPVVIDPLITALPLTLPEDVVFCPDIGGEIAIDGNTLAVGEVWYTTSTTVDDDEGAVSIFYRQADGNWQFQKRIQSDHVAPYDYFGTSVDLDGDILIVANKAAPGTNIGDGAFIFSRNQGGADNWGQVVELEASDPNDPLGFGNAVGIHGDWAFVGCQEQSTTQGRVFIYQKNEGGANKWGLVQEISAVVSNAPNFFGHSLAVSPSGEFLLVGAILVGEQGSTNPQLGAAHLYAAEAGLFVHIAELPSPSPTLEDFGASVTISDTALAVRASGDNNDSNFVGAVYAYDYSRTYDSGLGRYIYNVSQAQEIRPPEEAAFDTFGYSLGLNSGLLCIGQAHAKIGGAYQPEPFFFYQRDPGTQQWVLSRIMYNPQSTPAGLFGSSFDLTESHLAVAVPSDSEVQIYALDGHAGDQLGSSVCVEGDTIVVGANQADGLAVNSGAAYVFGRQTGTLDRWSLKHKIMANDGASDDQFGVSASLNGDIVVIGAFGDDDHGSSSGAAYAFSRNSGGSNNWGQIQKFVPADTSAGDLFGYSVGIWANRIVVGAPYSDAFGTDEGTAYLYESGVLKTNFDGFIAGPGDRFGHSVAIDGDYVVAGAPYNGYNSGVTNAGTAIVFKRDPATGDWSEYSTLFHGSPGTGDMLGWSVSLSGGHVALGAPFRDEGGIADSGAAFVYSLTPFLPPVDKVLVPYDSAADNQFGNSVALNGTRLAVGAPGTGSVWSGYFGSVYVFDQDHNGAGVWGLAMKRIPSDGGSGDLFGYAVDNDGDSIVVGAPWHNGPQVDSGAAYFYSYEANQPPTDIVLNPDSVRESQPVGSMVGTLFATDPNAEDEHTFTLVAGAGSAENTSFSVEGHFLRNAVVLDYETQTNYHIRVRATDLAGTFFEKALAVRIINVPDYEEDADADGMPDWWEQDNFGNPTNATATGNPDLDPHKNLDEFIAGSDPNSSNSYLRITNAVPVTGGFMVEWAPCISNRGYTVNWSGKLTNGFSAIYTGIQFPQNSHTDTAHSTEENGFYKVDVQLK